MFSKYIVPEQRVYNTVNDQVLMESDENYGILANSPPKEYLTRVMNNQLLSLCEHGKRSCIVDGFFLFVRGYTGNILHLTLSEGYAIVDGVLIHQSSDYQFDIDISYSVDYAYINQILISMRYNKTTSDYEIVWYFINNDTNELISIENTVWENDYLPIQLISFKRQSQAILFSESDANEPINWYPRNETSEFETDLSNYYAESETDMIVYSVTNEIHKVHSILPAFCRPRLLTINDSQYNFPCYTAIENKMYGVIREWIRLFPNKYNLSVYPSDSFDNDINIINYNVWSNVFNDIPEKTLTTKVI